MRTHSKVTDRIYNTDEMVYLTNPVQIAKYVKYGATVYDMLENNERLVVSCWLLAVNLTSARSLGATLCRDDTKH